MSLIFEASGGGVSPNCDVTVWNGLGEHLAQHLAKGAKVVVSGRLRWREFQTDCGRRQVVEITADSVPVPRADSTPARPAADLDARDADEDIPF
jgi:single-stranded DNA-binding protein